jgi:hypothetical protein
MRQNRVPRNTPADVRERERDAFIEMITTTRNGAVLLQLFMEESRQIYNLKVDSQHLIEN